VYPSFVEITVANGTEEATVCAALALGHEAPRIVEVLTYPVDFVPEKNVIIMEYVDRPGQLGKIGSTLGAAGINVESMQIAKDSRPSVEVLMNVDQPIPAEVRKQLEENVAYDRAWYIEL
jgi:D-3-phosphoglycerate dehydrogenase